MGRRQGSRETRAKIQTGSDKIRRRQIATAAKEGRPKLGATNLGTRSNKLFLPMRRPPFRNSCDHDRKAPGTQRHFRGGENLNVPAGHFASLTREFSRRRPVLRSHEPRREQPVTLGDANRRQKRRVFQQRRPAKIVHFPGLWAHDSEPSHDREPRRLARQEVTTDVRFSATNGFLHPRRDEWETSNSTQKKPQVGIKDFYFFLGNGFLERVQSGRTGRAL